MPLAIGGLVGVLVLMGMLVAVISAIIPSSGQTVCQPPPGSSAAAIPPAYLLLYRKAGAEYGIGWNVLAAVGKVESDHGRGPGSGIRSGTNSAGAAGPMQFLAGTWKAFGVDGNKDGRTNIYDPADAIPAAARYLKHNGAPGKIRAALFQYNHSDQYVDLVLRQARAYAAQGDETAGGGCAIPGVFAAMPPGKAAAAIAFARAQLGKPYRWGAEGPKAFDCSGLVYAAYRAAGVTIPRVSGDQWRQGHHITNGQEQPGDLVFFNSGPGTSTANPGHVGLVIGSGKMIAAPHTGTVVQIQPYTRPSLLGFTRPTATRS
ncbi:transglycosylase SLT domain-containing protein [Actinomadura sp. LD22]|uniref:Transglycosylase SLT domain-containing protein n=1 Tax=Actinomadura physcomitrii TaxID=2650748 RepID=A0A6I4MKU6_9ACTN|nr:bifunctional lytic transglycosylase/C40 family peptidase [Actinomadura physcomitrii]MWA04587.1 transglycosylase SLT domain-containing protein [Actinomadura physcomitrii]